MSALAELAHDAEVAAGMGHNNPPEATQLAPSPFDAVKVNMDDYLTEARNWADGKAVENQAQADEISRLIEDLRLSADAADKVRIAEKKPLDDKIEEIQGRYNPYIAGIKAKVKDPGKVAVAIDALKATLKVYLDAEAAKQAAAAEAARLAQVAAEEAAAAAIRAVDPTNLEAREDAEQLVTAARVAASATRAVEAAKPMARGGSRGLGLKKTYTAQVDDPKKLLLHYWATNRDAMVAHLTTMAQADIDRSVHTIPGVTVIVGTKL